MSTEDIETLFSLSSVVVAPAVPDGPAPWNDVLLENLDSSRFSGAVLRLCEVSSRPEKPIGVIALPQPDPDAVLDRMKGLGCRTVVLVGPTSSGGDRLAESRNRLMKLGKKTGLRIVGPSRLGVILPALDLSLGSWDRVPKPGSLALVTRSDSIAAALLSWAEREAIGFSRVVCLGQAHEARIADVIDALALDKDTRAILLHLDRVGEARSFLSAVRAASRVKPVIVLRAGAAYDAEPQGETLAARFARHDKVLGAALARAGAVRAATFEEMADAAEILGQGRNLVAGDPRTRPRVAVVTNGFQPGAIAADAALADGAVLAARPDGSTLPHDLGADASAAAFAQAIDAVAATHAAEVIVTVHWPAPGSDALAWARAVADVAGRRSSYRSARIVAAPMGGERDRAAQDVLRSAQVPAYETPERAVRAAMIEVGYARRQAALSRLPGRLAAEDRPDHEAVRTAARAALGGAERCRVGGQAADVLCRSIGATLCDCEPPGARSFLLGLVRDPVFGPIVVIAPSGREDRDTPIALALPPLDDALADLALRELRLGRRLGDREPAAAAAMVRALIALGELAATVPELAEVTFDGVEPIAGGLVVRAADAVFVAAPPGARAADAFAIRPYPHHLETTVTLRDGRAALMRPIRPEDARMLQDLFRRMTPEDRRMRLFAPIKELHDGLAARLTQIDYDREMCFVVEDPSGDGELMAGARVVCDPDGEDAEYAVTVRSDLKGLGLGRLVLGRALDYARDRGVRTVWGSVLAENRGMLGLAEKLGMSRAFDRDDPDIVKTTVDFTPAPSA